MASYRPFPPPPPPNQNPLPPPPPPPPQSQGNQYSQNWAYTGGDGSSLSQNYSQMHPNSSFQHGNYGASSSQHFAPPPINQLQPPHPPPHHQQQQQPYSYPPPPPLETSYPPPPPPSMSQNPMNLQSQPAPAPMYYPSSQYSQFNHQPLQPLQPPPPPPPPSSPPPSSSIPPPPPPPSPPAPPSSIPTVGQSKESRPDGEKWPSKDVMRSGWQELGHSNQGAPPKQHKHHVPPLPPKKSNGPFGRIETDEERRLRKKRELEKQRQEEKHRQQLKESQNTVLQKTQMLSSGMKGHGSISGSRMGERTTTLLSGERIENRLKKPTTFLCKLKFRNELPDPTAQPKLLSLRRGKDRFTKYAITSLEKVHKPQLYVEPDLGIPLDLLDLSVYNPPKGKRLPLDPEDEALLREDDPVTPIKKDGIKRKERPTDKGVSWLVKTQYISPLSTEATKQSLSEKQAKELRETRGGRNILENFNNRERKIREIEASFEACKSRPVHATNSKLQPIEILPLLPDFDRYDDQFVIAAFDSAPTADSETYNKLDKSVRDAHESQAIMKSFVATGSDSTKPEKFLAYMAPSPDELSKDMYDEREDISFSWVREYHWDVRGDDADDPTTYLVAFGESEAQYVPLPTKLILRKKRAKEGKSSDEVEHFPVPSRVTVRQRPTVAAVELKESGGYSGSKGSNFSSKRGVDIEDGRDRHQKIVQDQDMDQSSGAEYDLSD